MIYGLDTNIILHAYGHHMRVENTPTSSDCARLLASRAREVLVIPECFACEVLTGAKTDEEYSYLIALMTKGKCKVVPSSLVAGIASAYLRKALGRKRKHRIDLLGFCTCAEEGCRVLVTMDKRMAGRTARGDLLREYLDIGTPYAPPLCVFPDEGRRINPPGAIPAWITAWRRRARARMAALGARFDNPVGLASWASSYMEWARRRRR